MSGWLRHFRKGEKKNPSYCPYAYWNAVFSRQVCAAVPPASRGAWAGRSPGSPVCSRSLPCVLLLLMCSCPVLFLGPCFGGLYGFSGCHTPFVPVERIGRISFMGLKPTKRFGSGKLKNLCYYFCLEDNSDCFLTYCN